MRNMSTDNLSIKAKIKILKPLSEVFETITDPEKMTHYFIAKSSGKMESGKSLVWYFPEFEEACPIEVKEVIPFELISFSWGTESEATLVEMVFETGKDAATIVTVTEKGRHNDEAGIKWLKENTEGWANFLACLKAYSEYGINLRKGAFDY